MLRIKRLLIQARKPVQLLGLVVASSGALSAVFMNDTICLLFTPIVLLITADLRLKPAPGLIALAAAANAGSASLRRSESSASRRQACTIIGNP
ncbi:MAG: SLC13 family permease [Candidatus Aenigmarchaeota archaeon]|nr:SLC13 family permease [Candidatus Aenigmarchaeota archaeon]